MHSMKDQKKILIYDDYNSRIPQDQDSIGALTCNIGSSIIRNGIKLIELKRGYAVEVNDESPNPIGVDIIGNYSKSNFCQTPIVGRNGIAPTITENHGQVVAIVDDMYENRDKRFYYDCAPTLRSERSGLKVILVEERG